MSPLMKTSVVLLASAALAIGVSAQETAPPPSSNQARAATSDLPEMAKMDIQATGDELGEAVYDKWCSICHSPGPYPGTIALTERYEGTDIPGVLVERTNLQPAFVKLIVRKGVANMPDFRKTEITDAELDALADYLSKQQ